MDPQADRFRPRCRRLAVAAAAMGLAWLLSAGGVASQPGRAVPSSMPQVHPAARNSRTMVLMWHDVVAGKKEVWFDTTVKELEHQFQEIKRRRLQPVTLERLARHLETGAPIPPRAVVLTFDDNTLGLYRHLFPLVKRFRYPVVHFVHTDYVGVRTGKDHCTWEQLREMEASGLVKAYPHTASHPADMRLLKDIPLQREMTEPLRRMEQRLGGERRFMSYSNGFYDERVARAAHAAGYRLGITEDWGAAQRSRNLLMLRRYSMHKRAEQALRDAERG